MSIQNPDVSDRAAPDAGPASAATPSMTELVSGIINDAQKLIRQQVDMLRVEFKEDLRRTLQAVKYLSVGIGLVVVGSFFLLVSLVYLLHWLFNEVMQVRLPEWACWAIVGGVFAVLGLVALYAGKRIFDSFNPLPDKSMNALQENLTWITNRQS